LISARPPRHRHSVFEPVDGGGLIQHDRLAGGVMEPLGNLAAPLMRELRDRVANLENTDDQ
jgi:hypothetical protein